jgi:hypothetical protein
MLGLVLACVILMRLSKWPCKTSFLEVILWRLLLHPYAAEFKCWVEPEKHAGGNGKNEGNG